MPCMKGAHAILLVMYAATSDVKIHKIIIAMHEGVHTTTKLK